MENPWVFTRAVFVMTITTIGVGLVIFRPPFLRYIIIAVAVAVAGAVLVGGGLRSGAFVGNPNPASAIVLIGALVLLGRNRPWASALAGVLFISMLMAGSRLTGGASVALLGVAFIAGNPIRRVHLGIALGAVLLIGLYAWEPITGTNSVGEGFGRTPSILSYQEPATGERIILRYGRNTLGEIRDRVLPDGAQMPASVVGGSMRPAYFHNAPLQIAHDAGWLAAAGWVTLVMTGLWRVRRTAWRYPLLAVALVSTLDHYTWEFGMAALVTWAVIAEAHRGHVPAR